MRSAGGRTASRQRVAPTRFTARVFSSTARTPGARRIHSRSGCKTPAPQHRPISPLLHLLRPITRSSGASAWAAAFAAKNCSGLLRSTATGATIRASPRPKIPSAEISIEICPGLLPTSAAQIALLSAQLGESQNQAYSDYSWRAPPPDMQQRAWSSWPGSSVPRRAPPRNGWALPASIGRPPSVITSRSKASAPTGTRPAAD